MNVKPLLIAETTDVRYLEVFEGIHTYGPIWVKNPEEFYHKFSLKSKYYISNSEFRSGVAYSKIFAATVIPGFYRKQPRRGGEYYREFWVAALKSKPDIILITSWNELHEATEIEPTIECGFKYLRITRRYVEEYKGVKLPTPGKPRLKVEARVLGREVLDGRTVWSISLLISNNGSTALGIKINAGNNGYIEDYYPLNPRRNIVTIPMLDKGQKTKVNIKFFTKNLNNTIITITYYSLDGVEFNMTVKVYERNTARNITVKGRTTVKQGIAEFKVVFRDRLRVLSKTVYVRNGSLLKLPSEFKIINLNNGTILKLQGFILENGTLIGLGETIRVVKPMVIEASWVRYYKVNIEYPVEYVNVSIIGDRVNSYVRENSTIIIRARIRGLQPLAYYKPVIVVSGRMYENVSKLELRVTKPMVVRVSYKLEVNPLGAIILIVLILLILIIVRTVKGMLRFWSIIFISA